MKSMRKHKEEPTPLTEDEVVELPTELERRKEDLLALLPAEELDVVELLVPCEGYAKAPSGVPDTLFPAGTRGTVIDDRHELLLIEIVQEDGSPGGWFDVGREAIKVVHKHVSESVAKFEVGDLVVLSQEGTGYYDDMGDYHSTGGATGYEDEYGFLPCPTPQGLIGRIHSISSDGTLHCDVVLPADIVAFDVSPEEAKPYGS
jgi:hypothetical protein